LVFVDAIGHGRSSKPSDGMRASFPAYGYEDMVTLQYRTVTEALGLSHLRAIVGVSMGGMNAWRWAERYPGFMDAIVPIVALPSPIAGRNLIWRRFVALQIRNDPAWNSGNYTSPPRGWTESFPVFRMLLDGVPHLHDTVRDRAAADTFLRDASAAAARMDANDLLYALEASGDYDPSAALESIACRVFALNFGDDEFNPVSLGILEESMRRVPHGTYVVQPGNARSFGHFTQAHPELWAERLGEFMKALEGGS
jgi:homoserine O-acetyltransferase